MAINEEEFTKANNSKTFSHNGEVYHVSKSADVSQVKARIDRGQANREKQQKGQR